MRASERVTSNFVRDYTPCRGRSYNFQKAPIPEPDLTPHFILPNSQLKTAAMWQNHGFGDNGSFQNNFNQENFPSSPFGAGSGTPLGQSFFPTQTDMLQYEGGNGEGFISNEFHPEVGLFNQAAFMQNQVMNTNGPVRILNPSLSNAQRTL